MPTNEKNIGYKPTDGLSYDPAEEKYWDGAGLKNEIERTFEVCHGCRLCFKYCDAFPTLFSLIDERHDGDVRGLTAPETASVMDACFQCKLCEVQCPYTRRDGHEFQLDFPALVHRWTAQRARARGLTRRDRVLRDPDGTARLARASRGAANVANRTRLHRWFLEKALGIHRKKLLPDFATTTFEKWAARPATARRRSASPPPSWIRASSCGRSGTSRASRPTSAARRTARSPTTRRAISARRGSASRDATCCARSPASSPRPCSSAAGT